MRIRFTLTTKNGDKFVTLSDVADEDTTIEEITDEFRRLLDKTSILSFRNNDETEAIILPSASLDNLRLEVLSMEAYRPLMDTHDFIGTTQIYGELTRMEGQPEDWRFIVVEVFYDAEEPSLWIFDTFTGRGVTMIDPAGPIDAVMDFLKMKNSELTATS